MPIKRSQSAPNGQPIAALAALTKVDAPAAGDLKVHLSRSKSYLTQHSALDSPLNDREDPFSLGGFFPGSSRTAHQEEEQWKWLQRDEDSERASVSSFSVDEEDSVLGELDDELAREAIKVEDKLGVLSLGT